MAIYVTTSRKPSQLTRKLVKFLARLPGGVTENRGKRSVSECIERAENEGCDTVLVVSENHGNPAKLSFISGGEWKESILVKSIDFPPKDEIPRRLPRDVCGNALDKTGEKVLELLGIEAPDGEGAAGGLVVEASGRQVSFSLGGRQVGPVVKILGVSRE